MASNCRQSKQIPVANTRLISGDKPFRQRVRRIPYGRLWPAGIEYFLQKCQFLRPKNTGPGNTSQSHADLPIYWGGSTYGLSIARARCNVMTIAFI